MGIQFAPGARGRIEFSDRLLLSSRWVFQEARELMHRPGPVYLIVRHSLDACTACFELHEDTLRCAPWVDNFLTKEWPQYS